MMAKLAASNDLHWTLIHKDIVPTKVSYTALTESLGIC